MNGLDRQKRGLPVSAEINVTSLIDVAFTLLVIFIITAPIMQGGVEVTLPRARTAAITSADRVIVTVGRDGQIHIGEVAVATLDEFETVFPEYVRSKGVQGAYLRGDRDVPYGRVLQVLGMMKDLDVADVGLVAEPEVER